MSTPLGNLLEGNKARQFGMDKFAIRKKRLAELIQTRFEGTASKLADAVGIAPSYLYRLLSDEETAQHKRVGEKLAEKIETALKLPKNWLSGESSAVAKAIKTESEQDPYAMIESALKALVIVGEEKDALLEAVQKAATKSKHMQAAVLEVLKERGK